MSLKVVTGGNPDGLRVSEALESAARKCGYNIDVVPTNNQFVLGSVKEELDALSIRIQLPLIKGDFWGDFLATVHCSLGADTNYENVEFVVRTKKIRSKANRRITVLLWCLGILPGLIKSFTDWMDYDDEITSTSDAKFEKVRPHFKRLLDEFSKGLPSEQPA